MRQSELGTVRWRSAAQARGPFLLQQSSKVPASVPTGSKLYRIFGDDSQLQLNSNGEKSSVIKLRHLRVLLWEDAASKCETTLQSKNSKPFLCAVSMYPASRIRMDKPDLTSSCQACGFSAVRSDGSSSFADLHVASFDSHEPFVWIRPIRDCGTQYT